MKDAYVLLLKILARSLYSLPGVFFSLPLVFFPFSCLSQNLSSSPGGQGTRGGQVTRWNREPGEGREQGEGGKQSEGGDQSESRKQRKSRKQREKGGQKTSLVKGKCWKQGEVENKGRAGIKGATVNKKRAEDKGRAGEREMVMLELWTKETCTVHTARSRSLTSIVIFPACRSAVLITAFERWHWCGKVAYVNLSNRYKVFYTSSFPGVLPTRLSTHIVVSSSSDKCAARNVQGVFLTGPPIKILSTKKLL